MGLSEARRLLQWNVVMEALAGAGVDADTIEVVEHARAVDQLVMSAAHVLLAVSDGSRAKNYVKFEMVGMTPPFDRAYVELIRPGGRTSHELRELLRDRLAHVRRLLSGDRPYDVAVIEAEIRLIDEDLATEQP